MTFGNYAAYYDLLYQGKDYQAEADYVDALIKKYAVRQSQTILDIGCGTGTHASHLAAKGYKITGVDLSPEMIKIAQAKRNDRLEFVVGDARSFKFDQEFDVVLSLFDVINYQITNQDLDQAFRNASQHLKEDGLLIFDSWYGPAVLTDRPVVRVREVEDQQRQIIRISTPKIFPNDNRVDVNYEIIALDKASQRFEIIRETHQVRYLFKPEIDGLVARHGLETVSFRQWMTDDQEPGFQSWKVCLVGRLAKSPNKE